MNACSRNIRSSRNLIYMGHKTLDDMAEVDLFSQIIYPGVAPNNAIKQGGPGKLQETTYSLRDKAPQAGKFLSLVANFFGSLTLN